MKKKNVFRIIYILVPAALIIALIISLIAQSGVITPEPVMEAKADNCYDETLYVITDIDYMPYSFYDGEGNEAGHDVELIALIANEMHMNLDIKFMDWDDAISEFAEGNADILMTCDYSDTFEGVDVLLKSEPVSTDEFIVYSKSEIESIYELYEKKCAVMENGNVLAQIKMLNLNDRCLMCSDNRAAMVALEEGTADCAIMRFTVGEALIKELGYKDIKRTISIGQSYMCFGISEDNYEMAARINEAIETLKRNGELTKLHNKWLTTFIHPYSFDEIIVNNMWAVFLVALVIIAALLLFIGSDRKKRQAEEEKNRYIEIVENLANDFECVNYLEVRDNKLDENAVLLRTSDVLARNVPGWKTETSYTKRLETFTESVILPEDREEFLKMTETETVLSAVRKDGTYFVDFKAVLDGAVQYCQLKFSAVTGTDGDIRAMVLGVHNVDEIKRREQQQQEQLQAALDAANEEQLRTDIVHDIIHSGKWEFFVNAEDEIIGADVSDAANTIIKNDVAADGHSWLDIVHPDDKKAAEEAFNATIRDHSCNTPYDVNYRMIDRNGEYHWFHSAGRIVRNSEGNGEFFGIHVDITNQIEQQLEQQEQLQNALSMAESANRAKTTFLNNISHDIRTPMNAIIGYTELAEHHIDNQAQVQDYLEKIGQSSNHLLSLINDVLDMSRIESGKMNIDEKQENLAEIIHTLRNIVQADIHAKQQNFLIDTENVNNENIICDKLRLNQVLLNVISNSIKYTEAHGTISMRIIEKDVRKNYATYEFCIRDNGMGMDKEFLKTIFDPFSRVKSTTMSGIQGTGLGMAITKNIIDMMGGHIEIDSELGKGTETRITFDFRLSDAMEKSSEIPELNGVKGIIVDDDYNSCLSVARMLEDTGMSAVWCTTGKEAIIRSQEADLKGDSFKVFVLDLQMPDMNGIETARKIRKMISGSAPIIILTAYDWSEVEDEAREAGVTAFVSKPLFPTDLHKVLNDCLGRKDELTGAETEEYDFTGKKILLVEDNEINREIATEILEDEGFTVDTAEDGDIAVEKLRSALPGDYDLVLMDVQMPRMDGYEATRQIRAMGTEISKIPILAMTANAFEEDRKAALESGMNEHIAKPIDIAMLKKTLAKFL